MACQLSCHSTLYVPLAQLGSWVCCFRTVSGGQTFLVVTQLSLSAASGSFLTAHMFCWAPPKLQALRRPQQAFGWP